MSFLRPEATTALIRWREALIGGLVALAGLYWALTGTGLIPWLGGVVLLFGAALGWSGVQRGRFRGGQGGLGMVEVTERQITYLAPNGGGMASLDAVTQVDIARDRAGSALWRFITNGEVLSVPASAAGSDALFDALTALPGADIEAAIRALNHPPAHSVTIWGHPRRLH